MFNKLRNAVKSFSDGLKNVVKTRELRESDLEPILQDLLFSLVESDVAYGIAERIVGEIKTALTGRRIERSRDPKHIVIDSIRKALEQALVEPEIDIVGKAKEKCQKDKRPYVIVFMGVNGVGKTTTIAKVARLFQKSGMTPVIVAADTFRAGAQEQLELHARRLGVPIIKAKYNSDPAAVAYDAIAFASKRNYCVVLIDTAGRMHTDRDLIDELKKIIRVTEPDLRLLVVDALTGNDALDQAETFNEKVGIDGFILTKIDADAKGGTAVSITGETGKPIFFVGTGQGYDDLRKFSSRWVIEKVLGEQQT